MKPQQEGVNKLHCLSPSGHSLCSWHHGGTRILHCIEVDQLSNVCRTFWFADSKQSCAIKADMRLYRQKVVHPTYRMMKL